MPQVIIMFCVYYSYTIDGYPCTGQQMTWMRKRGILPARFIELQIIAREMLHRNELNKASKIVWELPLHDRYFYYHIGQSGC